MRRAAATERTHATRDIRASMPKSVVVAVVLAAFGPYIPGFANGGVRTEQLVVYALAILLLPIMLTSFRARGGIPFIAAWGIYIGIAIFGVAFPTLTTLQWGSGSLLGGLDNILLPVAVTALIWAVVPVGHGEAFLETVARVVATAMAINGLIAIVSTRVDLSPLLRQFWGGLDAGGTSVADRAALLGRYSGIFNQPAEAGALYGVAGLLAVFVWKDSSKRLSLVLALIIAGGLICVSKVFILGALPLILVYWIISVSNKSRGAMVASIAVVPLAILQSGFLDSWIGFNYLARLINPSSDGGALAFYTAGRFAEDSGVSRVVGDVLAASPLSGVGARGLDVPYDSAVTETVVFAGMIGFACYIFIIVYLGAIALRSKFTRLRHFGVLFAVLLAGSSLGFTPLTANRVSTVVWVVLALYVLALRDRQYLHSGKSDLASLRVG